MNINKDNLEKIKFSILNNFGYCWIAGGAIADFFLDKKPRDIDIYFPSEKAKNKAINKFKSMGAKQLKEYPLGVSFFYKGTYFDLVHLKPTPQECIDLFDYTVCCAAIDKDEKFYSHPNFFEDLGEKRLNYLGKAPTKGAAHPVSKARRMKKYLKKGHKISQEELAKWVDSLIKRN